MGVRLIADGEYAVMYDSVTERAFGPVIGFDEVRLRTPIETAENFLSWLHSDARTYPIEALEALLAEYLDPESESDPDYDDAYARYLDTDTGLSMDEILEGT